MKKTEPKVTLLTCFNQKHGKKGYTWPSKSVLDKPTCPSCNRRVKRPEHGR